MRAIIILLAATILSCASARNERIAEYRYITKDVCRDNPHEIYLAQSLYLHMVINKY